MLFFNKNPNHTSTSGSRMLFFLNYYTLLPLPFASYCLRACYCSWFFNDLKAFIFTFSLDFQFLFLNFFNLKNNQLIFLAVLGLRCCARAFSSCGERGLLFVAVRGPLIAVASLVVEHGSRCVGFSSCGSRAQ